LQLNARDGLTIAVSESPHISQIAKRTVLSTSALAVLAPILEEVVDGSDPAFAVFSKQGHADSGVGACPHGLAHVASGDRGACGTGEFGVTMPGYAG